MTTRVYSGEIKDKILESETAYGSASNTAGAYSGWQQIHAGKAYTTWLECVRHNVTNPPGVGRQSLAVQVGIGAAASEEVIRTFEFGEWMDASTGRSGFNHLPFPDLYEVPANTRVAIRFKCATARTHVGYVQWLKER